MSLEYQQGSSFAPFSLNLQLHPTEIPSYKKMIKVQEGACFVGEAGQQGTLSI